MLSAMRRSLLERVQRALSRSGWVLLRRPPALCTDPEAHLDLSFDHVISEFLVQSERIPTFVQVGAFDGVSGDLLHRYAMKGLIRGCLIEPQADAFEQLRANYAGVEGVQFRRAAIADRSGEATLYRVRPGTPGPNWLYQIASFRRDVLLKHAAIVPGLEDAIITESVPTITFGDLFSELGYEPDIVVIDTEGYDFEVIKLLDVGLRQPRIILYESKHLVPRDRDACIDLLRAAGYRLAVLAVDTVAYLPMKRS